MAARCQATRCNNNFLGVGSDLKCEEAHGHDGPHCALGVTWLQWKAPIPPLDGCQECRILRDRVAELEAKVRVLSR